MASEHHFRNALAKAMVYEEISASKRMCCDPYDCMHHEQCGEDWYGYCGTCTAQGVAYRDLMRYVHKRNLDIRLIWKAAEEETEKERRAYYKHTMYNDNAPAHWSDGGGYDAD